MIVVTRRLIILLLVATGLSACSKVQAKTQPEPPALDAPAPPPRVLAPLEAEPIAQAPAPAPPSAPRTAAVPPARPRPTAKPEPGAPNASPVDVPADRAPTADSSSGPVLQAAAPVNEAELERKVKQLVLRAEADLKRVDYRRLNVDARTQYDQAKRFIQQAFDALRERNVVLAEKLADKAAQLASVLLGR